MSRSKHVVQLDDLEWLEHEDDRYGLRAKRLARQAGGRKLGCTYYEIPPGKRPYPYHYHAANEEALYVVGGRGTLRLAGQEIPIAAGHYVACRTGAEGAHQIVNNSDEPLCFLSFSTMIQPEVAFYPDTGKIGAMAGSAPGGEPDEMTVSSFFRREDEVDYFHGEG